MRVRSGLSLFGPAQQAKRTGDWTAIERTVDPRADGAIAATGSSNQPDFSRRDLTARLGCKEWSGAREETEKGGTRIKYE